MAKQKELMQQIATRAVALDYLALGHYLPNPDPILKKMGRDISVYREVLSDGHVSGCVLRRKAAVKALEYRITTTENKGVDEKINAILNALPIHNIISEMLDATLFGYQALEVMWEKQGGLIVPQAIVAKPQEWFVFDEENNLRLRTKDEPFSGIPLPDKKMLLVVQGASFTNPYGTGNLSKCFWPATFKKGGFKFWLEFTEKYGTPWVVGKHPRQAKAEEVGDLLDSLETMLGTAVAAIPNDSTIDILEATGKAGSSQVFDEFLRYCKAEISITLLGQNQTTEAEANRASATAGLEVLQDLRDDDARLIEAAFNQLLMWICEINFNVAKLPKFELFEQESIDKEQAERDEILARIGVKFQPQYIERVYGFEKGDIEIPQQDKQVAFAEEDDSPSMADDIAEQLEVEAEPFVDKWLQDVKDKLNEAESLEDFRNQLDSLIPELSYSEYAKLMTDASISAELAGRYAVVEESK